MMYNLTILTRKGVLHSFPVSSVLVAREIVRQMGKDLDSATIQPV